MTSDAQAILQILLGLVFLLAGLSKIMRPGDFVADVASYQLLAHRWVKPAAILLLSCELLIGVAHLSGMQLRVALVVSLLLLFVLLGAVLSVLHRGLAIRCACFGSSDQEMVGGRSVARLLLVIGGETLLWMNVEQPSAIFSLPPQELAMAALAAVLVLIAMTWLLSFADIKALVR